MNPDTNNTDSSKGKGFYWALRGIGFIILGVLIWRIGTQNLINTLTKTSGAYFWAAVPIFFVMIWIKSLKIRVLMTKHVSVMDIFKINAFTFSLGVITPGRVGEFTKIPYLTKRGIDRAEAIAITLVDRILDVAALCCIAICGMFVFFGREEGLIAIGVCLLGAITGIVIIRSRQHLFKLLHSKYRSIVIEEVDEIQNYLKKINTFTWIKSVVITFIYVSVYFVQMWILVQGLGITISYVTVAMAISASSLTAMIPISLFNIGPRDLVLATIFEKLGLGAASGVALSTLILALFIVNGMFGLLFNPDSKQKED